MNYDDWKLQTPPEQPEYNCRYCGEPNETDGYCSPQCKRADYNEN